MRSVRFVFVLLFAALSAAGQVCVPAPHGIISWYPAEGTAKDVIGTNHGGIVGGVTFGPGKVQQALQFHGLNGEYVNLGDVAAFNFTRTSSFTIEAWVKVAALPVLPNDGRIIVSLNYRCNQPTPATQMLAINPGGKAIFVVRDSTGAQVNAISPAPVPLNTWVHLVGVRDAGPGCKEVRLYVDGALAVSKPDPTGVSSTAVLSNTGGVPDFIGRRMLCGTYNPFQGSIDEVSIYNRALTACEISALHNASCAGKCSLSTCPMASCGC